jgi:hypothetical protein
MNKKKIVISIIFFLIIFGATFYIIFSKNNVSDIYNAMRSINISYIMICIALCILYFIAQGIYMKIILKTMKINISLPKGIFYSTLEFFFSGTTPGSTGGQPVQLYYMAKDKIPNEKSLIVLITDSLLFKLFLVIFGIMIIAFDNDLIFNNEIYNTLLFFWGLIVDIIIIVFCLLLMFSKKLIVKIIYSFYKILNKITKKEINIQEKAKNIIERYCNNANYIKSHRKEMIIGTIIIFIQRILMFSITYVIYRGFGFNEISYIRILLLQVFIQITIEGLPFPGGTGAIETISNNIYITIFGELTVVGTLLNRTLSFYLPLMVIAIVIVIVSRKKYYITN